METTISTTSNLPRPFQSSAVKTVAWLGLLAGILDICAAFIMAYSKRGTSPTTVLQYIASAVFGKEAYTSGASMAVLGLIFHFIISYGCVIVFFWLYPKIKFLSMNVFLTAVIYAIAIWVVTTRIIVPLSKLGASKFVLVNALQATGILFIAIALPVTYFTRRFYRTKAIVSN